eukprot:evm.model.NODE_7030_length_20383_cov_42.581219.2
MRGCCHRRSLLMAVPADLVEALLHVTSLGRDMVKLTLDLIHFLSLKVLFLGNDKTSVVMQRVTL